MSVDTITRAESSVPLLSEIPILGEIFRHTASGDPATTTPPEPPANKSWRLRLEMQVHRAAVRLDALRAAK